MTTLFRKFTLVGLLLAVAAGAAACENTIRGMGEDTRETSDAISDTAS
ncbi:entericidin [Inquilinus sp. CAU 1745]